jgi:hypothetical protein
MDLVKYGCTLTGANKAGTSLTVAAFSDSVGGTTSATVSAGDLVLEAAYDAGTSTLTGTIWLVNEGDAWQNLTPTGPAPGTLIVATSPDVPYQQALLIVFLDGSTFATSNLNMVQSIVDAAIGAL